jgi:hypothetical protein
VLIRGCGSIECDLSSVVAMWRLLVCRAAVKLGSQKFICALCGACLRELPSSNRTRKITERRVQSAGVEYTSLMKRGVPNVDSAELRYPAKF